MKKRHLAAALLLALSLTGCGQRTALPTAQTAPAPQEESSVETAADRAPTAEELGREERMDMAFSVEGETEMVPATLYIGQGYSIYIPDEGWRLEKDVDDGIPEETWESTVSHDVELRVLHLGEKTLEEARAWVTAAEDDYRLIEDKQGGLGGTDGEDRETLEVRFYPSGTQMYAVLYEYPTEAAEGFGARLEQIAGTFEVTE